MITGANYRSLNDLEYYLKDIRDMTRPRTDDEWVKIVETTARYLCNDNDGKRINFRKRIPNYYDFEFDDMKALECGINAINIHINHMPILQQMYYKKLLLKLEHEKRRYI